MFSRIIKIKGKTNFDQLTKAEVALMIEAFLNGGNKSFDKLALNEFLHEKISCPALLDIQIELQKNTFIKNTDGGWPTINEIFLNEMIRKLSEFR